jgi:hypothetical protein
MNDPLHVAARNGDVDVRERKEGPHCMWRRGMGMWM